MLTGGWAAGEGVNARAFPMRVLIADDDHAYRSFLKHILTRERGFHVVAEAWDSDQAVERAKESNPDVILLDLHLPRLDGLQACRSIRTILPEVRIIILSEFDGEAYRSAARKYGSDGLLAKGAEISKIITTVVGSMPQGVV